MMQLEKLKKVPVHPLSWEKVGKFLYEIDDDVYIQKDGKKLLIYADPSKEDRENKDPSTFDLNLFDDGDDRCKEVIDKMMKGEFEDVDEDSCDSVPQDQVNEIDIKKIRTFCRLL